MPIRQSGCPDRPRRLPAPEPSEARRDEAAIESRLLAVWISAGILGFQDGTLALDLVNCTVLSWLWFERHGLESVAVPQRSATTGLPALDPPDGGQQRPALGSGSSAVPQGVAGSSVDPMGASCEWPHNRIDAAVVRQFPILGGLGLGGRWEAGTAVGPDAGWFAASVICSRPRNIEKEYWWGAVYRRPGCIAQTSFIASSHRCR